LEGRTLMSGLSLTAATVSDLIAGINAANAAGGANTITLAAKTTSPYVLTAANNSTYGATGLPAIAANDNLTIVGNGDTIERSTVTGTPDFRLLEVASGGSLTMENLTLQGGYDASGYGGGAIYNQGTLVLNDVTVQDNHASSFGGGIYSDLSSVTLLEGGTIVQKNIANAFGGGGAGGGLYCVNGAMVTVTNTTLDNNSAAYSGSGGSLYVDGGNVSLSNDTIESNSAFLGGGLFVNGSTAPATVTLSYDTVESNNATEVKGFSAGGALYVDGANVTLSNDTLESNKAGDGGGLYVTGGSNVTLANDAVESNTTTGDGGGLFVNGGSNVTLSNDTLESNRAQIGGGLYVVNSTVTLSNDTVESNSASIYGGGIYHLFGSSRKVYLDSFTVANTINNTDNYSGLNGITANIDGPYILQNP